MMKRCTSLLLAVVCLFSMFAFFAPMEVDALSVYKVTKVSGYFDRYTSNFNKQLGLFSDSVVVRTNNTSGEKYYIQVAARTNCGSWYTYANKLCYDEDAVISFGYNLNSKPNSFQVRFRVYTQDSKGNRVYGPWSSAITYKFTWNRPWYKLYSDLTIQNTNNGMTKKYHTCIW